MQSSSLHINLFIQKVGLALLLALALPTWSLLAQNTSPAALEAKLNNPNISSEEKLQALLDLAGQNKESHPDKAIDYAERTYQLAIQMNQPLFKAEALTILGYVYAMHFQKPLETYKYHKEAYEIYTQLYETGQLAQWKINSFLNNYAIPVYKFIEQTNSKKRKYKKALRKYQSLHASYIEYLTQLAVDNQVSLNEAQSDLQNTQNNLKQTKNNLNQTQYELQAKDMALIKKNIAQKNLIIDKLKLSGALKEKELEAIALGDSLLIQQLDLKDKALELSQEKSRTEQLAKEKALKEADLARHRALNISLILGGAFVLLLTLVIWFAFQRQRKVSRLLRVQREEIHQQKEEISTQRDNIEEQNGLLIHQKSEIEQQRDHIEKKNLLLENQKTEIVRQRDQSNQLLLNILPEEIAKELKENGRAKPQYYDMCTVLFTDFKGFTGIAEALSPTQLVQELDACFLRFDEIISKYNLEKIKTIGDAYMCAGGIPVSNKTNPIDAVKAGLAMQEFMDEFNQEKRRHSQPIWELRVGIHTGPLIAGVIGKHKFAYDVWGDTVNLAARMESSGEVGKVNISGATYELVKTHFNCSYRGKIQAKNKGEMDMYFIKKRASLFQGIQNMVTHPVTQAS